MRILNTFILIAIALPSISIAQEECLIPSEDQKPGSYRPGLIMVVIDPGYSELIEALSSAYNDEKTTTGVAFFDSIGIQYGLKNITAIEGFSEAFLLFFDDEADLRPVAIAYCSISHISAFVDIHFEVPTNVQYTNWASLKKQSFLNNKGVSYESLHEP